MKFESRKIAIQDQTTGKASAARYTGRQVIRYAKTSADQSSASAVHPVTTWCQ